MEMILLDWTRLGKLYCLAGAVAEKDGWKIVRPLLLQKKNTLYRNVGWSPYLLDGHCRWEVFFLVGGTLATPQRPHLEDLWVRGMHPLRRQATPAQRRAILEGTNQSPGKALFGAPLTLTRTAAFLAPGIGDRSLATLVVPARAITFDATQRVGVQDADYRVSLNVTDLANRWLPVKDHHLLQRAEMVGADLTSRIQALTLAIRQMGDTVAVRLGLSRGFNPSGQAAPGTGNCWLMADGFFSFHDPQP